MDRYRVAILIPAFNEASTIAKVVEGANKFGKSIVIDDGSKDQTAYIAKKKGAIVLSHKSNLGYDAALNSGFKKASQLNFNFIITLDADGQHNTKLIPEFIRLLDKGNYIVIGVRSKKNRFSEYLFGIYTNYKYQIIDPLCGFKGYRLEGYKLLGYFDSYKSIGTELMFKIITAGMPFKQLSFNIVDRKNQAKFGNLFSGNLKILRSFLFCIVRFNSLKST